MTNSEFNEQFRNRTRDFAIRVIRFLESTSFHIATKTLSFQLSKCATSVGANFRAFCRGRSRNEFYAKICIVVEEADETIFWLEILDALGCGNRSEVAALYHEASEILKISSKIKSSLAPS